MTDIVERLRALAREYHQHRPHYQEAAAEIERLQAKIGQLQAQKKGPGGGQSTEPPGQVR